MGLFRVLILALFSLFAVLAGLVTAAALSLVAALFVFGRRMLRPVDPSPVSAGSQRLKRAGRGEVIDISATEVPATEVPADSSYR